MTSQLLYAAYVICILWGDLYNTSESLNAISISAKTKLIFVCMNTIPRIFLYLHIKLFSSPFILAILSASDLLLYSLHQVSPYPGFVNQKKCKTIKLGPACSCCQKITQLWLINRRMHLILWCKSFPQKNLQLFNMFLSANLLSWQSSWNSHLFFRIINTLSKYLWHVSPERWYLLLFNRLMS